MLDFVFWQQNLCFLIFTQTAVGASYFMTYHTILKTSKDYYEALEWARDISKNITNTLNEGQKEPVYEVFPYR